MNKPPTQKQIDAEIKALTDLLPLIPPFTAFGDNNIEATEDTILVLRHDWDEDEIHTRFGDDERKLDSALEALRWKAGEEDESPSSGWDWVKKDKSKLNKKGKKAS